jgi:hypothetical protein
MDTISTSSAESQPAKPKIIGSKELIKATWATYQQNWQKFAILLIVPLTLSFIANILSYFAENYLSDQPWYLVLIAAIIIVPLFIVAIVWSINSYIAQFLLIADLNQPVSFDNLRDWLKRTWPYFWIAATVSFVYGVFVFLGFIALIIPGIIVMVLYAFTLYFVFFEEKKFEGSFGKSRELVRGYFWPVFGRFCLGVLIIWAAYFLLGIIAGLLFALLKLVSVTANKDTLDLLSSLFSVVVSLVVGPLTLLYTYNIYKSLKGIKK